MLDDTSLGFRFRADQPLSERVYRLSEWIYGCRALADALEKSMTTGIVVESRETSERCEAVSRMLSILLEFAAENLSGVFDEMREA